MSHLLQLPWFPEIGALPYIGRQSASQAFHQGTVQVLQTSSGLHFARSVPQSIDWEMGAGIMHGQEICIYTCTGVVNPVAFGLRVVLGVDGEALRAGSLRAR